MPVSNVDCHLHSFYPSTCTIRLWNLLPKHLQECGDTDTFKAKLDDFTLRATYIRINTSGDMFCSCLLIVYSDSNQFKLVFIVNTQFSPILPIVYTSHLIPRGNAETILVHVGEMLKSETTDYNTED